MRRSPSSAAAAARAPVQGDPAGHKVLAAAAFVLMAAAMTVRPILGEMWNVQVNELVSPSPLWWNTSPAIMYLSHLIAAAGLGLGGLWVVLKRRAWHFSGLEPAVLLLVLAGLISVPGASDKRLAINVAIGTILPIAVAAVLVQVLDGREGWRRALLAAILAGAAANCWRATRQQVYEYEQTLQHYLDHKAEFWAQKGKSLEDPSIPIFESRMRAHQPSGYFYHPNVLACFMLLGVAAATAAASGMGRLRRSGPAGVAAAAPAAAGAARAGVAAGRPPPAARQGRHVFVSRSGPAGGGSSGSGWPLLALLGLGAFVVWQVIVIQWVGSLGAKAGLGAGIVVGLIAWLLRRRARTAGLVCLVLLAGLQTGLMVLAANADTVVPAMARHGGKLRSMAFRLNYWHGAMQMFARHPIRGVGPGQFGEAYPSFKPARAAEEVAHPHNWLVNMAAEWGAAGLAGTVLGLVLPAWMILRRRPGTSDTTTAGSSSDQPMRLDAGSLVLALLIVTLCWLIFLPGVVPAGTAVFLNETFWSLPLALAAAGLAGIPLLIGRVGRIVLTAGLAAFFVHATVEMSSGVAGAAWPFWAIVALVLSSGEGGPEPFRQEVSGGRRWWARPAFGLAAAGALAVLVLSLGPSRAILAMSQAKSDFEAYRGAYAEGPLLAAARADPLDPAPHATLAECYRRMAYANPERTAHYLRLAVEQARAAADLDPGNHTRWNDLAVTAASYATTARDAGWLQEAIAAMRRAVAIYPNWPRGHLQLAWLLAEAGQSSGSRPEMLAESLAEYDAGLRLNEQWPDEDPNRIDGKDLDAVRARRQRVQEALGAAASGRPSPATRPG